LEIKQAFDIFDEDGSGKLDPCELVDAFSNLGFSKTNKFVYQILSELESSDQSQGIDFPEFLKLATAKISEKDSRAEINKVFNSFDINKAVTVCNM
jgi:Ca2+-binding EF-hand superfamily protein